MANKFTGPKQIIRRPKVCRKPPPPPPPPQPKDIETACCANPITQSLPTTLDWFYETEEATVEWTTNAIAEYDLATQRWVALHDSQYENIKVRAEIYCNGTTWDTAWQDESDGPTTFDIPTPTELNPVTCLPPDSMTGVMGEWGTIARDDPPWNYSDYGNLQINPQ